MSDPIPPQELINLLVKDTETLEDENVKQHIDEAVGTIKFLLKLLDESASYIEDHKEYEVPPRFIKAVREILPR